MKQRESAYERLDKATQRTVNAIVHFLMDRFNVPKRIVISAEAGLIACNTLMRPLLPSKCKSNDYFLEVAIGLVHLAFAMLYQANRVIDLDRQLKNPDSWLDKCIKSAIFSIIFLCIFGWVLTAFGIMKDPVVLPWHPHDQMFLDIFFMVSAIFLIYSFDTPPKPPPRKKKVEVKVQALASVQQT